MKISQNQIHPIDGFDKIIELQLVLSRIFFYSGAWKKVHQQEGIFRL